jgi:copper chaperone
VTTRTSFTVTGMTCGHCVQAVRDEVARLPGVTAVDVDLATGALTIDADQPIDTDTVRGAVDEAGYQLSA